MIPVQIMAVAGIVFDTKNGELEQKSRPIDAIWTVVAVTLSL